MDAIREKFVVKSARGFLRGPLVTKYISLARSPNHHWNQTNRKCSVVNGVLKDLREYSLAHERSYVQTRVFCPQAVIDQPHVGNR